MAKDKTREDKRQGKEDRDEIKRLRGKDDTQDEAGITNPR